MKYGCYLFDLDGTLVDSLLDLHQAVNHVLTARGGEALSVDVVRSYIGDGVKVLLARSFLGKEPLWTPKTRSAVLRELADRANELHNLDETLMEFRQFYLDHVVDHTRCYEGVRDTLQVLESAGVSMGVVSNKPEAPSRKILDALGILRYFDVVVGGDTAEAIKPDPAPVLHALTALGRSGSEALMTGDSANDILAGRSAGCETAAVTYGFTARETLVALEPDRVVQRLDEILD